MRQVSWRAHDDVVERVRRAARRSDRSLNEYITVVLAAATDPATAGSEVEAIRERLALAGLLEPGPSPTGRRPSKRSVDAAGHRAAGGTPLEELVKSGR
jgi:hypothetical protein